MAHKDKKIKVVVKQKHINGGQPSDGEACPIALALYEKGYSNVVVEDYVEVSDKKGRTYQAFLPKKAETFIEKYDNSSYDEETETYKFKVKPFEFELKLVEIPEEQDAVTTGE